MAARKKPTLVHTTVDHVMLGRFDKVTAWLCATQCPGLTPRRSIGVRACLLRALAAYEADMASTKLKTKDRRGPAASTPSPSLPRGRRPR